MNEIYLEEALNQMEDLKKRVDSIASLLERAYDKKKMWCPHCQVVIRRPRINICPRCGVELKEIGEKEIEA